MLANVLNRVLGRQKERQAIRAQSYRELVESVANNTEGDEAEIEQILIDAGRTVEDLAKDVELILNRQKWAAEASQHESAMKAVAEVNVEFDEARREREAADKVSFERHRSRVDAAKAKLDQAQRAIIAANNATVKLRETHPLFEKICEITQRNVRRGYEKVDLEIDAKAWNQTSSIVGQTRDNSPRVFQLQDQIDADNKSLQELEEKMAAGV